MPPPPSALRREPVPPMEVPATAAGRSPAREAEPAAQSVEIKRIRIMIHRVEQRFSSPLDNFSSTKHMPRRGGRGGRGSRVPGSYPRLVIPDFEETAVWRLRPSAVWKAVCGRQKGPKTARRRAPDSSATSRSVRCRRRRRRSAACKRRASTAKRAVRAASSARVPCCNRRARRHQVAGCIF